MPTPDDIEQQQKLLAAHRSTLAHYLKQRARIGQDNITSGVAHGIDDARAEIARIKGVLRGWGVDVEDLPDEYLVKKMFKKDVQRISIHLDRELLFVQRVLVIAMFTTTLLLFTAGILLLHDLISIISIENIAISIITFIIYAIRKWDWNLEEGKPM
jgi:hypothetical protein